MLLLYAIQVVSIIGSHGVAPHSVTIDIFPNLQSAFARTLPDLVFTLRISSVNHRESFMPKLASKRHKTNNITFELSYIQTAYSYKPFSM